MLGTATFQYYRIECDRCGAHNEWTDSLTAATTIAIRSNFQHFQWNLTPESLEGTITTSSIVNVKKPVPRELWLCLTCYKKALQIRANKCPV